MAKISLAVKYRPKSFDDLTEQSAIRDILCNQIETDTIVHGYLFTGPAGTGKTTSARIFANMINKGKGNPIEIDAASNSGVDNIRGIIEDAKRKPLDAEYKVYIVDECHSLSNGAWQALLKLLEEPPKFTIFILATTDPQKIPGTILSRVQRFQFNKISNKGIVERLDYILEQERKEDAAHDIEALEYIAKVANGGMRDSITLLDKCLSLSPDITLANVLKALGTESYDTFFSLLDELAHKQADAVRWVENIFNEGKDIKQFMKDFAKFVLDVEKYLIFSSFDYINIPKTEQNSRKLATLKEYRNAVFDVMELVVSVNNKIKWETDVKTFVELELLLFCKEE